MVHFFAVMTAALCSVIIFEAYLTRGERVESKHDAPGRSTADTIFWRRVFYLCGERAGKLNGEVKRVHYY